MKQRWLLALAAGNFLRRGTPPPAPALEPSPAPDGGGRLRETCAEADVAQAGGLLGPAPLLARDESSLEIAPPSPGPEEQAPAIAEAPAPDPAPDGLRVVVSIPLQKAYVFDDGELVATSPVSTGKRGHETPTGRFRILQ